MKAVMFDLFETLITEFADGARKVPRINELDEQWGLSRREYDEEWRVRQEQRMNGTFPDYPSVLRDMWQGKGKSLDEAHIQKLYSSRLYAKSIPFQDISPHIIYMLKRLKANDLRLGLISNCTEEEVRAWESSGLASYFDEVIFSYQTGYAKPDARIYELACTRLQVRPEESVFVGDGGSQELEGAAEAGMKPYRAAWFAPRNEKFKEFEQLQEPEELLVRLGLD
ncbi:HAD family hydrolase [Paenibacillus sp. OAS669]|uniref:HAD family hydrolase n=1 Tax=Paenibacillus sp. OAS669 TaxID=2663821 RepID=UPI001789C82D|nr:HAD family hydrolase [Paenibacillus sp. OAS669]MBE1446943.1 putative hydrolase of the HAD superfamily [Paenibacillus sp. OAS669]